MERKVLGVRLIDKVKSDEIRKQTMFKDAAQDARERKLRGPTISSDFLDDHHTDGDEKWNHWSKLAQYRQKSRRIQKAAEGSASNQWLNRIFKYQAEHNYKGPEKTQGDTSLTSL
uniref:Uncharacterized protein n=1 Tax=Acrobeloides nanus TaxID=290746 RepID=A0A914DK55_9BILA